MARYENSSTSSFLKHAMKLVSDVTKAVSYAVSPDDDLMRRIAKTEIGCFQRALSLFSSSPGKRRPDRRVNRRRDCNLGICGVYLGTYDRDVSRRKQTARDADQPRS
ncbi:Uncharacterized protein FWK35_00025251 [Aphis craccivora]|uniref:Uncharacterized protein n=1 Tax=Aphis craccivora TaxID=307492 RepID=A0A6G0YZL8_APHCR|nr:Uncharacterized protein FWK35_00025251 [Aphis craccivora]